MWIGIIAHAGTMRADIKYSRRWPAISKFLVLSTIGALLLLACGSSSPPTPTPDVPQFTRGEATGLVKMYLTSATKSPYGLSCLEVVAEGWEVQFDEQYIGNGVWKVTGTTMKWKDFKPLEWQVFENSLAVNSLNGFC